MNGVHDMGGMHGFGPVEPEPNEPAFHGHGKAASSRMHARHGHAGGWNIDMSRFARENLPPAELSRRVLLPALVAGAART